MFLHCHFISESVQQPLGAQLMLSINIPLNSPLEICTNTFSDSAHKIILSAKCFIVDFLEADMRSYSEARLIPVTSFICREKPTQAHSGLPGGVRPIRGVASAQRDTGQPKPRLPGQGQGQSQASVAPVSGFRDRARRSA